ncbi:hypothetical protein CSUI_004812, partial [Cystoisospora suis]
MALPRPLHYHSSIPESVSESPRIAPTTVTADAAHASSSGHRPYQKGTERRRFSAFSARVLRPLKIEGIGTHGHHGQEGDQKATSWFSDKKGVRVRNTTDSRAAERPAEDHNPLCRWAADPSYMPSQDNGMCTVCLGLPARRRRCSAPTQSTYVRRRASCTFWPARMPGKGRTRSNSCVCSGSRDLEAGLRLPIPVRRTIQDGPRG